MIHTHAQTLCAPSYTCETVQTYPKTETRIRKRKRVICCCFFLFYLKLSLNIFRLNQSITMCKHRTCGYSYTQTQTTDNCSNTHSPFEWNIIQIAILLEFATRFFFLYTILHCSTDFFSLYLAHLTYLHCWEQSQSMNK